MPASLFYYPSTGLERVRAIFNFTSYAVLMFFFFCDATSTFRVPSSSLPPFSDSRLYFPLSAPPTLLFSHCHLPLTPFVFFFLFLSLRFLSLKCLCFLSIWFPPLCFHLSLSGGVAVLPYMLIMFLCSERKLLNHSHQDPTHAHMHKQTRSSHTVFFCLWKCAPPPPHRLSFCRALSLFSFPKSIIFNRKTSQMWFSCTSAATLYFL